ncbi:MAG: ATP-binding protein [bacterium]
MKKNNDHPAVDSGLRGRAEDQLKCQTLDTGEKRQAEDTARLLHELQVHQIELEMQNEELQQARTNADALLVKYIDLYNFAPAGYFTFDREGSIRRVNFAGAQLLDTERSLLLNRRFGLFVAEENRCVFNDFLDKVFSSKSRIFCELTIKTTSQPPLFVRIAGISSEDGSKCRAVITDLTERKQTEQANINLQAQLFQAQKLESLEQLVGGVAHDFNNMVMGALGYTQLCREELPAEHPAGCYLDEITTIVERSANLTRQLLTFSRRQTIAPKVLALNDTMASIVKMLRRLIGENIDLILKPGPGLWPIKFDPTQIDQILINLCLNARDAIAGVGKITITTANVALDQVFCNTHPETVPGDYVLLMVSDNGCGMEQDILAKIFEPFFTTKEVGKGTGLGLAMIFGIVKQNIGYIEVSSEPGQGSTFRIYLPLFADEVVKINNATTAIIPQGSGETILLVEDEPTLRIICEQFLKNIGYKVLTAESPIIALELARIHKNDIRLLLTDVIMPGMNGRDLSLRLLEMIPGLKVLFMSGYTPDVIARQQVPSEGMHYIQKPFSRDDLARKMHKLLEHTGA